MTVLYHKRRIMHSIFQIRISQNTKCADKTGFPRPGHICIRVGQFIGIIVYRDIKVSR